MPETTQDLERAGFDLATLTDPDGDTWEQWRDHLFQDEFCAECGLDGPDHEPWIVGGHWFAHCTGVKLTKLKASAYIVYVVKTRLRGIRLGEVCRARHSRHPTWSIFVGDTAEVNRTRTRAEAVEKLIELARDRGLLDPSEAA
jgi:hypothetical protein